MKSNALGVLLGLLACSILFAPVRAGAIAVKKELYRGGGGAAGGAGSGAPGPKNPLTPALQKKLIDVVSNEAYTYISEESEKKATGKVYVDLESAKMRYVPSIRKGATTVTCKLEAPEYKAPKQGLGKGRATGKRKVLIFKYELKGQNWAEAEQPKWENVASASAKADKN